MVATKPVVLCALTASLFIPHITLAADLIPDPNAGTYINQQAQPCELKSKSTTPTLAIGTKEDVQCTVNNISDRIISIVIYLMGAIAVLLLIFAGIQYILSNGNPDGIKKSRATITNTVLGIIVLTAAYAIINIIIGAVGYFNLPLK